LPNSNRVCSVFFVIERMYNIKRAVGTVLEDETYAILGKHSSKGVRGSCEFICCRVLQVSNEVLLLLYDYLAWKKEKRLYTFWRFAKIHFFCYFIYQLSCEFLLFPELLI